MASGRFGAWIVLSATLFLTALTVLAALADRLWFGDMITFVRPELALATALALAAALWLGRWKVCAALATLLALNVFPLVFSGIPFAQSADGANLRILSANVLFDHPAPARFGEVVKQLAPDIIVTQEAKYKWPDALRALTDYPYLAGPDVSRWNGNLVLSRYPLRARLVADMPPSGEEIGGGQAIRVEADLPGHPQPLVIYAIHAPTPRTLAGWRARNRYLQVLAERIAAEPSGTPILLAGDWNTPVWSPSYARTLSLAGLRASERSLWPPATRVFAEIAGVNFGTPVDHIAVSEGIGVADLFPGPGFGSDHIPVVADLNLP
ncbi:MAG: endonuclease/exonuclease/phosphatase family protein [Hyphomicrobiales bacterium]|nr:endonuclease/exonuclease/phosphatase family protein [Hyphomicrobiales bacterium]